MPTNATLGTHARAALTAANTAATGATTWVDHGANIWLANHRDGGTLLPTRNDDRMSWHLADGKTVTSHCGAVSANDGRTGALLAIALTHGDDHTAATTAAKAHAAIKALGVTTTDLRGGMVKGLTYVAKTKTRGTAKALRDYVDGYVATRDAAVADGKGAKAARKVAVDTVNDAAGVPARQSNGNGNGDGTPTPEPVTLVDVLAALVALTTGDAAGQCAAIATVTRGNDTARTTLATWGTMLTTACTA